MKNILIVAALFIGVNNVFSQLNDCSLCSTQKYSKTDIKKKELYELKILRNEIFARHQYVFENERLNEYFSQLDWYKPNSDSNQKLSLNAIEKHNIDLFKNGENELLEWRNALKQEFINFKEALNKNDLDKIKVYLNNVVESEYMMGTIADFKKSFNLIDLNNMHWYTKSALHKISIDNGHAIQIISLHFSKNEIILTTANQEHSEIMIEPFEYPSTYESESEYAVFSFFNFDGEKLRLEKIEIAG